MTVPPFMTWINELRYNQCTVWIIAFLWVRDERRYIKNPWIQPSSNRIPLPT